MARGYRVLLWHRPNTGGSGLLFEPVHMFGLWADVLRELLSHASVVPAYLAGAANGLLFSPHFAVRYPDDVNGLILIGTYTDDEDWWRPTLEALSSNRHMSPRNGDSRPPSRLGGRLGWQWQQFRLAPHKRRQLLAMDPVVVAAGLRAWAEGYGSPGRLRLAGLTSDQVAGLACPAVVFSGPDDADNPDHARALHHLLPRSELALSPDYHGSMWDEKLQDVVDSAHTRPPGDFEVFAASFAERISQFVEQPSETGGSRVTVVHRRVRVVERRRHRPG